ncbi:MAG: 3-dehydro-L-gulonate 2-dehydrogenase [Bacteroidales bacterium]
MDNHILIPQNEMRSTLLSVMHSNGFKGQRAETCAHIFTSNSLDGIYTHGINRFPRFIRYIQKGYVKTDKKPELMHSSGSIEQWNGRLGPGPNNALDSTYRAMELAKSNGISCVGLSNTNHWMRGGYYGWEAAKSGFIFMGWSNTIANMPAWGAKNSKLGNNPMVLAVPYHAEAIVLDMAMSQFSYGTMEAHQMKKQKLPIAGGFDKEGNMTTDPDAILDSGRSMPAGYWKGAGLSLLLDIIGAILSGGDTTFQISRRGEEYGVSQVFIAIDTSRLDHFRSIEHLVKDVIDDLHNSVPASAKEQVYYPGERVLIRRKENSEKGIPVEKSIWEEVLNLNHPGF